MSKSYKSGAKIFLIISKQKSVPADESNLLVIELRGSVNLNH